MRWVSPGADKQGYDFPIADTPLVSEVPTTEGDTSFEVNLNEINNINVDPATGARFLYLDVTTLSGASENAFHVWAGPNDYVETFPTDVNARNLAILNNPGSHDSRGIQVEAISRMTINNIYPNPIDWPIAYLPSSTAGGNVYVSIFDMDDGAQPPITFFFDSIPESAWSLTFNEPGVDDPDGVAAGVRCDLDGTSENNCNDQWTTPPYTITIPGNQANCDRFDLNDADCIPFTGGTLMARVNGGMYDTSSWEVKTNLPKTVDTTQSCAAFPIAVPPSMRSLAEPFSYPNSEDFDYPLAPPSFGQFVNHIRAVTLADATEGTVFKVSRGISNASYDFGWLKWNLGITGINGSGTSGDNAVLANSLTWPGYSMDYADHDDPGSVVADGISHVVRGYVEPGDATDQVAHVDDWVAASGSQLPAIAPAVNELIDEAPVLRLIVWDAADGSFGANGRYTIQQFALFKIIGYGNSNAEDEWLLLEFIGLDNSCGQLQKSGVDLVIDELQIIDIDTLQLEQPLTAQVTISNVGTVDIAHSWFTVDFYLNPSQTDPLPSGDMFGAASFTNLPVGAQKTISYTFSSGTNQQFNNALYAKVDSSDFIIETDKTNNVAAILNFKVSLNERFVYLPVVHR
ncbi:MAG: hypothetical protein DWQ04_30005 [Chloroflexi bacterium]|nr:MAG: hypothetical protein DWQ04_30005 [Chloroflexota bacterium]